QRTQVPRLLVLRGPRRWRRDALSDRPLLPHGLSARGTLSVPHRESGRGPVAWRGGGTRRAQVAPRLGRPAYPDQRLGREWMAADRVPRRGRVSRETPLPHHHWRPELLRAPGRDDAGDRGGGGRRGHQGSRHQGRDRDRRAGRGLRREVGRRRARRGRRGNGEASKGSMTMTKGKYNQKRVYPSSMGKSKRIPAVEPFQNTLRRFPSPSRGSEDKGRSRTSKVK